MSVHTLFGGESQPFCELYFVSNILYFLEYIISTANRDTVNNKIIKDYHQRNIGVCQNEDNNYPSKYR